MSRIQWILGAVLALPFVVMTSLPSRAADEAPTPTDRPRAEMREVFEAVAELLPRALSEQAWADPDQRKAIERWLDALASRTALVERHAMQRDVGYRHLSQSLSTDIQEVRERYRAGRYEESRFFMIQATGNCVACHARLPDENRSELAGKLIARIDFDALSAHEQTQILVSTRQFDRAMSTWEAMFTDPGMPPGELDLGGYLLDYMTIGLRVQSDPDRVRGTLEKLAGRPDVPVYLRRHLAAWVHGLRTTAKALSQPARLDQARELVLERSKESASPFGRDQTVYDLVASSLLLQVIDDAQTPDAARAEAYYLLGVTESRTVDSHWVPQAEVHLESAIRLAPDAPFAEDAYAVLEEYVIIGWGGASSTDLPADEWARLNELRALIDASRPAATIDPTRG